MIWYDAAEVIGDIWSAKRTSFALERTQCGLPAVLSRYQPSGAAAAE